MELLAKIIMLVILLSVLSVLAVVLYRKKSGTIDRWFIRVQPYLLLLFIIGFVIAAPASSWYFSDSFLPPPVSEEGEMIVPLFNTTVWLTGAAFFLTQILLFVFAYLYRTKRGRKVRFLKGNLRLELFWTLVPAGTFIFLFLWGQILWARIHDVPDDGVLEIDVMGQQFSWQVRYAGPDGELGESAFRHIDQVNTMGLNVYAPASRDDFVPVQMHIPKGRPVQLLLRSKDVIHSFYLPHFRIKMDALPGMPTRVSFTANTTTAEMRERLNDPDFNFEAACTELCGRMHFAMKLIVVVDEPEEFEEWYRSQESWVSGHPAYVNAR